MTKEEYVESKDTIGIQLKKEPTENEVKKLQENIERELNLNLENPKIEEFSENEFFITFMKT
jgi:hypothetical protein